ncbi:LacI family transcriptional regulator [Weissella paramesenteroides]|nr:LacI family transcriptional regulator [Weissella paramesenteroides]MCS9998187.1 LacI family transcriptional regulator [Weissella paramesenteroides]MCT0259551.1 LacI family transcriptional regulator [Weissella paramesenteroides]
MSRILSQDTSFSVSEATEKRVWQIANKLQYKLSNVAVRDNSEKLHLALVSAVSFEQELNDSYFQQIKLGLTQQANLWGMKIANEIRLPTSDDIQWERLSIYGAVLVVGVLTEDLLEKIYQYNQNIVIIDDYRDFENYDVVLNDFGRRTKFILDLLHERGHQNIAFIGGNKKLMTQTGLAEIDVVDERQKAYVEWMKINNLLEQISLQIVGWGTEDAIVATKKIFLSEKKPTAIVTGNDLQAVGVYRIIQEKGYKIPEDIAVVSFDDIDMSQYLFPSLTTVRPNTRELGKVAINLVRDKIVGDRMAAVQVTVNSTLEIRESI